MKKAILLLLLIGVFIPFAHSGESTSSPPDFIQKVQDKRPAPPFTLKCLDGGTVSLSEFKGKPVLVKFWATWCPTCKEELPLMEKLFSGKKDQLATLLLAIDGEKESRVKRAVKDGKVTLPVLLDEKEKIARTYGVKFIPAAFLIDRDGMIVGTIIGEREWGAPTVWPTIREFFSLQ